MREQLVLLGVFVALFALPAAWRLLTPIPPADVEAIRRHLGVIDQTPQRIRRMVVGGPWDYSMTRRFPMQVGRPYQVTAREADGSLRRHVLAADGVDGDGLPHIRERLAGGAWTRPRAGQL